MTWDQVHAQLSRFRPVATPPLNLEPNNDVRPTTHQVTARLEQGDWVLEKMRWGLVPFWRNGKPLKDTAKGADDGWKLTTFNCVGETAVKSPTFRDAYAKRRCLIPANAWYEWTGEKGAKTKHTFARSDGGVIWFGGLWDRVSTPDAGDIGSFTIVTRAAEGWLTDYHGRAPVILEREDWAAWLMGETVLPHAAPDRFLRAA